LLIKQMDLRRMDVSRQSEDELRTNTRALLEEIVLKDTELPPEIDRQRIIKQVLDEVVGLGPLEDLLADELVTEIMVNRYDEIFIERAGKLTKSDITFTSDLAVVGAIERIVAPLGRRIDESSPMVDARLKDRSGQRRDPPLALKGTNITIHKFSKKKLQGEAWCASAP
jgi:pilus assembly protein CpaF